MANSKKPAGAGGPDSALASTESKINYRSNQNERKGFVTEMCRYVPEDGRILACQFRGDPAADIYGKWRARPLGRIDDDANVYFTVAAFRQNDRGEWRRRKDQFAGGILLMIDDLGDGPGSKFQLSKIDELPPTALIETSPGNFQAIYMFNRLVTDQAQFNALISAFVREKFLDQDTGMAGVNRVFRPPFGINGKDKYKVDGKPWRVQLTEWDCARRYSVDEIVEAFGLEPHPEPQLRRRNVHDNVAGARVDDFEVMWDELQQSHMVRAPVPRGDWWDIYCPWEDEHTGGDRTGAAIAWPSEENCWHGGFRCHHGHGGRKYTLRDLTDWLSDEHAASLEETNRNAPNIWIFSND